MKISPKYNVSHWIQARDTEDWQRMVGIFNDRLEGRFLEPIRLIAVDNSIGEFSGFSIMSLDCLIIETLEQFYNGNDETKGYHKIAFRDFFRRSPYFQDLKTNKKAEIFYSHFRCGLLHQAQTKNKSLIKIGEKLPMVSAVSTNIGEGLVINREKFHEAIENEIKQYIELLKSGEEDLRANFVKKMNYICNTPQI